MTTLKTSNIWIYFTTCEINNKVKCKICHKFLRAERSFNLRKHLKSSHKIECRSDRRCRYARVKIGPTSRDVIKYPLIDPKHVEPGDTFFDLSSQTLDQSNDSEGKDSNSILPTNSPVIEIKEEVMQHGAGTDYMENNTLTNEAMPTNEQESVGNNSNLTNPYPDSSIETLNVPANTATIYVQAPTTSSSAITVKPISKDSFNSSSFLSQRMELPSKSKKRRTLANATPTACGKDYSDPLDENTSSSKDYNSYEEWSKRKKDLLEIELLEMRNYKVKLELWEKEKALQVSSSVFTKDIMGNQ
ncbi:uncharacterized protein ACRADG_004539 [Cochliomyia hominivorax]